MTPVNEFPPGIDTAERQEWLATLARAPRALLQERFHEAIPAQSLEGAHAFEWLRPPETGLTMIRARIGNSGDRFNVGEATLTRCAVRYVGPDGVMTAGIGYVRGRDVERARWIAALDALLQQPSLRDKLTRELIAPLRREIDRLREIESARTATSRVSFFTLHPET